MSIVFSIYLSSSLPPRDFISTLHEEVVCTILFSIFGDLTQGLELQILPLIEEVPSKTVGSYPTRGSEAVGNNKVVTSTASMNHNMQPTFVVCIDRCCARINEGPSKPEMCLSAGFDIPIPGRAYRGCDPAQLHNERDPRRREQKDSKSNNVYSSPALINPTLVLS